VTSPNRPALVRVARALGPLREEVVLVGGQVAELLVTDPAAVRVRPTDDVDLICDVATASAYDRFAERLRAVGFREVVDPAAPLCRWRHGDDIVDVMPVDERVHGLRGSWYPYGMRSARPYRIAEDLEIRVLSAPAFLATKWEAFEDRGEGDLYGSADMEDVVTVIAGRQAVVEEIRSAERDVRRYLADRTSRFLDGGATPDVIAGALPDARLVPGIVRATQERLVEIAGIR
jgi:predicted nucleotidyltransferase